MIKEECKQCIRLKDKSCTGTDYWNQKEHYYCILDWKKFKQYGLRTRFVDYGGAGKEDKS